MGRKSKKKRQKREVTGTSSPAAKASGKSRGKVAAGASGQSPPTATQQRIGRFAAGALGIVFILAGTLKVGDPWSFLGSLPAYGVPSQ